MAWRNSPKRHAIKVAAQRLQGSAQLIAIPVPDYD
jgi:hypothetical protein